MSKKNANGKFFVIDGGDASGKETQTKLLIRRMRRHGLPVKTISFPQYGEKSAGAVEEYLHGLYGKPNEVGPYRASVFFAVDRYAASKKISLWLNSGYHVVADRYVASNMAHQGGKIKNARERKKYFHWNESLEYKIFGIPRPNLNLILHVPARISINLLKNRAGKKDAHERDKKHLRASERTYLVIARLFPGFKLIECVKNGELLSRQAIHERIWNTMRPFLK